MSEQEIAAAVTLRVGLGQTRELTLQTYIPRDADVGAYHAVLDKLGAAADRQDAKGRLVDLHREVAQVKKMIGQATEDFNRIEVKNAEDWTAIGKKGAPRLSSQEEQAKKQAKVTVERYHEELQRLEGEIRKTKEIIG